MLIIDHHSGCEQKSEDITTEYNDPYDDPEIARASKLLDEITDNVTRALDFMGWMIVMKSECDDGRKWPCGHPAPSWCNDLSATVSRLRFT
jgi:hypothetical protein